MPPATLNSQEADNGQAGGIYVHFPFCTHRCNYCDFVLTTPKTVPVERYTDGLIAELSLRADGLHVPARTLYIGGGTPSLWPPQALARFVDAVRRRPGLAAGAEVTVEANPRQVDAAWIAGVRAAGITRVSLGIQALRDDLLAGITRRHSGAGGLDALKRLLDADFQSVSADLMFGLAGQQLTDWRSDLDRIADTGVPHLSIYNLTVEPRTALAKAVSRRDVVLPTEDDQLTMLFAAEDVLRARGFVHYEVSSYAQPGHIAQHNSSYWEMRPYLGLGVGAHGFADGRRWSNIARVADYLDAALVDSRLPEAFSEQLDADTYAFERLMTGLRRLDIGVAIAPDDPRFGPKLQEAEKAGWLTLSGGRACLTKTGTRLMDTVLRSFLPDPPSEM